MASLAAACYFLPAFLSFLIVYAHLLDPLLPPRGNANDVGTSLQQYANHAPPPPRYHRHADELHLLDTVLLASVDGRFHALNRTTGIVLWSMEQPSLKKPALDKLPALVRTDHPGLRSTAFDQDVFDDELTETYIIEPQTGALFVKPADAARGDPLQKLPFSMAQLVEMSPFRMDDRRTFVGKRKTSLITLDLHTGEILDVLDPDRCAWDEQPSFASAASSSRGFSRAEDLLDEIDDEPVQVRTLVHIGRTDYHVSVISHGRAIQTLTFSSYGPNNLDKDMQYLWHRTPDNWYHQPAPDGTLWMFKTDDQVPLKSLIRFTTPVVAVFDTASISDRQDPLVLLQPTPSLNDLYPSSLKELQELGKEEQRTVVGRISDSLYALSRETYPLVIWSRFSTPRTIDYEGGSGSGGGVVGDEVQLSEVCTSLDCLKGVHPTKQASMARWVGLLPSYPPRPPHQPHTQPSVSGTVTPGTTSSPPIVINTPRAPSSLPALDPPRVSADVRVFSDYRNPIFTGILGLLVLAWVFAKRVGERWRSSVVVAKESVPVSEVVAEKELPIPQEVVVPVPVAQPLLSPETVESKPLPPVPPAEDASPTPTPTPESTPVPEELDEEDGEGGDETEKEGGAGKRKKNGARAKPRRKRGQGNRKKVTIDVPDEPQALVSGVTVTSSLQAPQPNAEPSQLVVSETVLGYGSHGTVVYQGAFQGRAVAVKRLLQDFVTLAAREVALLQESDDHPNVIRYYFKESKDNFLYIALELCPASLADVVERPATFSEIVATFDPKRALAQVTMGLKHLHSLKIVHRDIKPQNILISKPSGKGYRMMISDFGLCRKLESDQTSFLPTMGGGMGAGTVGWRAPEILKGEVKLDEPMLDVSSGGTPNSSIGGTGSGHQSGVTRLTKSVDVFALGCLYYYTLTNGDHPYGDRYERERNIVKDVVCLDKLDPLGEEGAEAGDLIRSMLDQDPKARPDTSSCLVHPYFWSPGKRLNFLQDASDRFEIMCREPRDAQLEALERGAVGVVGNDWHRKLDKTFDENLGKFRKYDGRSVQDLLRALRNKKHHYQDIPDPIKRTVGPLPEGYLAYFTRKFPRLFLHVYATVARDPVLKGEMMFRTYFEYVGAE